MKAPLAPVSFARPVQQAPRLSAPYVPGRHDKKYWSAEEKAVISRYYPSGGVAGCLAHLPPHRTPSGVYQQARLLGLKSDGRTGLRQSHPSNPELDARIVEEWQKLDGRKKGEVADLADRLEVPRWWLSKRATALGLSIAHKKEPPWTAAEDALMRSVPLHDPDRCAEIFRQNGFTRTATAIVVRAKRLDLSRRATRPTLSATKAAKILGVDGKTITRLIIEGDLAATKRQDKRLPQQGGSSWDITRAELRRYVIDRLETIDLRKVEKFGFVDLLVREQA